MIWRTREERYGDGRLLSRVVLVLARLNALWSSPPPFRFDATIRVALSVSHAEKGAREKLCHELWEKNVSTIFSQLHVNW